MTLRTALEAYVKLLRDEDCKHAWTKKHKANPDPAELIIADELAALLAAPEEGEGQALQRLRDAWNKLRESNFHDSEAYENMQEAVQAIQPAAPAPRPGLCI